MANTSIATKFLPKLVVHFHMCLQTLRFPFMHHHTGYGSGFSNMCKEIMLKNLSPTFQASINEETLLTGETKMVAHSYIKAEKWLVWLERIATKLHWPIMILTKLNPTVKEKKK